eukprot:CAMPEP_0203751550 /NCGR_PEP_ID=MMETSP0098-20131031/5598_1 /ASSEMBLY_ACC=CAM_ASM_000208 /TAXON_ID=96639 /ORGANISM=" , Strain NY0313808BC1" /LENGTH=223 /DNA_ID=CAMNT_0050641321 /DNA_START=83 /DNA_END=754 /DNA_ORIENTATION=-
MSSSVVFRQPRILCIAGSTRPGSFNVKLMNIASRLLKAKGAEVTVVDMEKYDLPLFSEEIEKKGTPQKVHELKAIFRSNDGLVVATPEYNGGMSPLLLNTLTWMSRNGGDDSEPMYVTTKGKVSMLISSSPGGLGGLRGLYIARQMLTNLGVTVIPEQIAVGGAYKAFKGEGDELTLESERQLGQLDSGLQALFEVARGNANQEATCAIARHMGNEYGEIILP